MPLTSIRRAAVALVFLAAAGCTVKSSEPPPLTGPSGLALTLTVSAIPDSIRQDGGDQSSIRVTAIGPDGKGLSGVPIRVDMFVNGAAQDYGTLSARSIVTNSDGVATVIYTAPPSPTNGAFGTCSGLPGNCISIVATATATNFVTANPQEVQIRLVPTGVILPPASTPTAAFTISPTPVNFNIASTFDASTSCGGSVVGGVCGSSSAITSYTWNFGDGFYDTGKVVTHTYVASTTPATSYSVVLTVTNDRGLRTSTTQVVSVNASPAPTGDWVFSPALPNVGDTVFFNADALKPAAGHQLVQFSWNFGDGSTASGFQTTHVFLAAATYTVTLSVLDDAGQKTVTSKSVLIGSGRPIVSCVALPPSAAPGATVTLNASGSQLFGGQTVRSYAWDFADPGSGAQNTSSTGPITTHQFVGLGTHSVTIAITDTLGRQASGFCSVTVQ